MAATSLPSDQLTAFYLALFTVCFPFAGFLKNLLFPAASNDKISVITLAGSALCSITLLIYRWAAPDLALYFRWFSLGKTTVTGGLWLNDLSLLMLLLVSLISLAVCIYSIKYMEGDKRYPLYWTYMSFFAFAMLGLVISATLIQLYFFWELVGFASYLLVGFWYEREKASAAAKKAFLMNRIGDTGFLIGIMIVFSLFRSFSIPEITSAKFAEIIQQNQHLATWAGLAFFLGAMAKSAQFPLFTWLPDAMEGPTAVSSLLHAATMVAAGVFLMARLSPFFSPEVLSVMAIIGAITALLAAYMALTQHNLKRILAYSTISQLGFMILAIGVHASGAAVFHLVTHAFFKCLLFLSSGVVIHYMGHFHDSEDSRQDITRMGGLSRKLPFTFLMCSLAALALAGIPFTSGFLSKDAIIIQAFDWASETGDWMIIVPLAALFTSWLTAFYISRLIFSVFFHKRSAVSNQQSAISHELSAMNFRPSDYEPKLYWLPMMSLALCSLFPLYSLNPFSFESSWIFGPLSVHTSASGAIHYVLPVVVTLGSVAMIWLAWQRYVRGRFPQLSSRGWFYRLLFNQLYLDKFYDQIIVHPLLVLCRFFYGFDRFVVDGAVNGAAYFVRQFSAFAGWFDGFVIDGFVNATARVAGLVGHYFRNFQSGRIQRYLTLMLILLLIICLIFVFI